MRRLIGRAVMSASLLSAVFLMGDTQLADAHSPTNCYHGTQVEGSWTAIYIGHGGSPHFNYYDHYLRGSYQHSRRVLCGT